MGALDKFVELVAFGKTAPAPAPGLGLYLSPDVVYLSETHLDKAGKLIVDHLLRVPIAPSGETKTGTGAGTMNTDFLSDPLKIAGPIRSAMTQTRWSSSRVRVTLSHHLGLLRYFTMPAIERRFLKSAVPLEAKKTIPIPFEALAYDYRAELLAPDPAGKPRLGVLISVTQKKNIENVLGLLKALGLKLDGLEVAPCSALRLWQATSPGKDEAPYMHVHIDGGNVRVMAVERGAPVFLREVFLPGDATVDDLRKIDLRGCMSFVLKQAGVAGLAHLRVSGNIANLEEMKEAFAQETGLPAAVSDVAAALGLKSAEWGGYAALGASVQSLTPQKSVLDIAAIDRVTDEERQTARDILIVAAAAALALGGAGAATTVGDYYRARELQTYQRALDPGVAEALKGKDVNDVDNTIRDMQLQLNSLRTVMGANRAKLSDVIREIVSVLPENVWLDRFEIHNPMTSDAHAFSMMLRGHAQDQTVGSEESLAFQFKDAILKNAKLGGVFDVSLSLQGQAGPAAAAPADPNADPRALAEKREERTTFLMELKAKH